MPEKLTPEQEAIYTQTAIVHDFCVELFESGKLKVDTLEDALRLGQDVFEDRAERGLLPDDWRDNAAYGELIVYYP